MTRRTLSLPIISHELHFVARNIEEVDAISEGSLDVDVSVKEASDRIYKKATTDAGELLTKVKDHLGEKISSVFRIKWQRYSRTFWQIYGGVYDAKAGRTRLGSTGFNVGSGQEGFRLIGWTRCYGGLSGLEELTYAAKTKNSQVHLASENLQRYPGWVGGEDAVIWFDRKLKTSTSLNDLRKEINLMAKPFFQSAKPVLKRHSK